MTLNLNAQSKNVKFTHGINGDENTWSMMKGIISQTYPTHNYDFAGYTEGGGIMQTMGTYSINYDSESSIVIAHSMGGLVAREYIRQNYSTSKIDALITVGTPHNGAKIAGVLNTNPGEIYGLVFDWADKMALGPMVLGDAIFDFNPETSWARGLISSIGGTLLTGFEIIEMILPYIDNAVINRFIDSDNLYDMDPNSGSTFLGTLNSNFTGTVPVVHYAIYGTENWNTHWRLIATTYDSPSMLQSFENLTILYYNVYDIAKDMSLELEELAQSGEFSYGEEMELWELYFVWKEVAQAFFTGYYNMAIEQHINWNSLIGANTSTGSDGIVPTPSAMGQIDPSRLYRAWDANHIDLTDPYHVADINVGNLSSFAQLKLILELSTINLDNN